MINYKILSKKIKTKLKVSIIGLGYVGLLGMLIANKNYIVYGIDKISKKLNY